MASFVSYVRVLAALPLLVVPGGLSAAIPTAPACGTPTLASQTSTTGQITPRRVVQLHHVPEVDLTFSGRLNDDGGFTTEARGGDLVFSKRSLPGGGFTLELSARGDMVQIEFGATGVTVRRDRKRAAVNLASGSDDELDAVRRLLAGSTAVRLTRRAADALYAVEDASLAGTSLFLGDALVGLLTGDEGAPGRMARHLVARGRGAARRIQVDCYAIWESRVVQAYNEYEACYWGFPAWNTMRNLCAYRWVLQVETYWFSMISCVGFNQF